MAEILLLVLLIIVMEVLGTLLLATLKFLKDIKPKQTFTTFLKENLKDLVIATIICIAGSLLIVLIAIIR